MFSTDPSMAQTFEARSSFQVWPVVPQSPTTALGDQLSTVEQQGMDVMTYIAAVISGNVSR